MAAVQPIFSTFPKFAFGGITIPISRISVKGGIRHHNHEFPHAPGAEPEKMGRKLYTIRVSAHFHELPNSTFAENYLDIYPGGLSKLRVMFEDQKTDDLVIPSIGTIKAFCTDWEQMADFERALSGEEVSLDFQEDQASAYLTGTLFELGESGLAARVSTGQVMWAYTFPKKPNPFDQLNDIVSKIQAISGLMDATNQLIAGKLAYISQLCSAADREVKELQAPENHLLLEALKDVWSAANDLTTDITTHKQPVQNYWTPRTMSAGDVSTAIYGDASHALEILNMNPIEDAFAIPGGTHLRYVAA
jgi:prophage DNA circulation protein